MGVNNTGELVDEHPDDVRAELTTEPDFSYCSVQQLIVILEVRTEHSICDCVVQPRAIKP